MKTILLSLLLLVGTAFLNTTKATGMGACSDTTVVIKVKGLTCSGDCKDISAGLKKVPGVKSCEAQGKPGALTAFKVTYDPALVKPEQIQKAVESTPGCEDPDSRPYKLQGFSKKR